MKLSAENFSFDEPTKLYHDREELLRSLKRCFSQGPDVDFHGMYELSDPGITHKQRIQTITHEIWKTTGYRFTCVINLIGILSTYGFSESRIILRSPMDIKHDFGAHRTKLTGPSHQGQHGRLREPATHLA